MDYNPNEILIDKRLKDMGVQVTNDDVIYPSKEQELIKQKQLEETYEGCGNE